MLSDSIELILWVVYSNIYNFSFLIIGGSATFGRLPSVLLSKTECSWRIV